MPELVQIEGARPRLPAWARRGATHFESLNTLKRELRAKNLHTVCESARCPNIHECFHRGAATFMILGNLCTRGCGFCSVPKGNPRLHDMRLDPAEPANVARMAADMHLRYVVITSVNRDDLPDGGSEHFATTVAAVRQALPASRIEVLTPDFCGNMDAVARVLDAGPDVFNHNMETVPRLYRRVRPQASYRQSLDVLAFARRHRPGVMTKSGFMVGLGETADEVEALLRDLREQDTDVATIGQYLQPTRRNLQVKEYVTPEQFERYRETGVSLGFRMVFSGPLVRSSYMADVVNEQASEPAARYHEASPDSHGPTPAAGRNHISAEPRLSLVLAAGQSHVRPEERNPQAAEREGSHPTEPRRSACEVTGEGSAGQRTAQP